MLLAAGRSICRHSKPFTPQPLTTSRLRRNKELLPQKSRSLSRHALLRDHPVKTLLPRNPLSVRCIFPEISGIA